MKNLIRGVICIILMTNFFSVSANNQLQTNAEMFEKNYHLGLVAKLYAEEIEEKAIDICYKNYVKETIPAKFVKPFVEMTNHNKSVGLEILGIGFLESNWKYFKGKMNNNGSIDLGPLMLNSFNIENEKFMIQFASNINPKYVDDIDIFYMCICINYYESLRSEHGPWNSLQIYNGGWRTIRKDCPVNLKKTVTIYANRVYNYINKLSKNWKTFHEKNIEIVKNEVAQTFLSRLCYDLIKEYNIILIDKLHEYNSHCEFAEAINSVEFYNDEFYNDERYYNYIMSKAYTKINEKKVVFTYSLNARKKDVENYQYMIS